MAGWFAPCSHLHLAATLPHCLLTRIFILISAASITVVKICKTFNLSAESLGEDVLVIETLQVGTLGSSFTHGVKEISKISSC